MPFANAADGTRIHFEVTGRRKGTPVVLIQGLGATKSGWNLQRVAMATRYNTIALDNRGAGRSDAPARPFTLEQMADDVVAVMDEVGVDSAHIVGASMGGVITQIIGVKYPERVRSLTLVCTACRNHPWREDLLKSWASTAQDQGMFALGKNAAQWVMSPRSFRRLLPAIGWLGPLSVFRSKSPFVAQVNAILQTDETLTDQLATIAAPTLVIVGNQDVLTPRGDSEELADIIPNSELVVISGAAHGLMIEHASTFNREVFGFIDRVESRRSLAVSQ
jgi:3-oxoadipate enol-lactonase